MSTFSDRLREERVETGMSQTEFAAVAGVGKQSQINYESGKRHPDASYLSAIAGIGVDVLYILTGRRELSASQPRTMKDVHNAVMAGAIRGTQVKVMGEVMGEERPIYNVSLDGARLCRILCPGAFLYAIGKRSSNMMANWLLTACHSRTERFHS